MKTKFALLVLLTLLLGVVSCSDDNDDEKSEEYVVTVASVQRLMFISDHHSPYYVKYEGGSEWKNHPYIYDFSHVEGYEYVIRVRRDYDKSMEGLIDGSSVYDYHLVEEISKTKKESENIPVQKGWLVIASKGTENASFPYYAINISTGKWEKMGLIEGFEYEEGYEYQLEVDCKYNGVNAPQKYSYKYLKTARKEQKDSEGLSK